jgi:hypothetical protein
MRSFFTPLGFSLINSKSSRLIWTTLMCLGSLHFAWAEGGGGGGDLGDGGGSGPEPSQGWFMFCGALVLVGFGLYTRSRKKGHQ